MKKTTWKDLNGIILLLLLLAAGFAVSIWLSYHWLRVTRYEIISGRVEGDVRMVVLSDLHDHKFGKYNEKLIEKVKQQSPDLILMDGDMLNKDSTNAEVPCIIIEELAKIAPVYYALGNQEELYIESHPEFTGELERAGAILLDKTYTDVKVNGTSLRLGGMYDYAFGVNGKDEADAASMEVKEFLKAYQDTDRLKIMLAHRPDSFIFGDASKVWDVDLVISGHNHGGQVVLPFLGGVYGGDQGLFPKYIHGLYKKDKMTFLMTSGLGSGGQRLPRLNNPPEIVTVTIKKK